MAQRIELNLHSNYDEADSVIEIRELVKFAKDNNMPAVALTDQNCAQGFLNLEKECQESGVKPIFGAEIVHGDYNNGYPFVSTVLVKNQKGLKNLYRIISELKNDGVCFNVPISVLEKYHEGLLYGSCGHEGAIYTFYLNEDFEQFERFAEFYDYFEIGNLYGNKKEKK